MCRLVAFGHDSDLELTLRTYKVLSRADVGSGKLDTDVGRDIVRTADGVYLGILSSEVVDLILKNPLDIIGGLLRDTLRIRNQLNVAYFIEELLDLLLCEKFSYLYLVVAYDNGFNSRLVPDLLGEGIGAHCRRIESDYLGLERELNPRTALKIETELNVSFYTLVKCRRENVDA